MVKQLLHHFIASGQRSDPFYLKPSNNLCTTLSRVGQQVVGFFSNGQTTFAPLYREWANK
jgi:hypothetical protein